MNIYSLIPFLADNDFFSRLLEWNALIQKEFLEELWRSEIQCKSLLSNYYVRNGHWPKYDIMALFSPESKASFLYGTTAKHRVGCCYKWIENSVETVKGCLCLPDSAWRSLIMSAYAWLSHRHTMSHCVLDIRWRTDIHRVMHPVIIQNMFFNKELLMNIAGFGYFHAEFMKYCISSPNTFILILSLVPCNNESINHWQRTSNN